MPDAPVRLFTVTCKDCERSLMTVDRIRDPEIASLQAHARICCRPTPLGDIRILGDLLRHFQVAIAEQG